jgi:LPS export ABC transporter protein LptC
MVSQAQIRLVAPYFFAVLTVLSIGACTNNMQSVHAIVDKQALDTESADSVTLYFSTNGITKAVLKSKTFKHVLNAQPPYVDMSNGLRVEFFDVSGNPTSVLTAKRGRYFEADNNVLVRDSVCISNSSKGETLKTEELIWNDKRQLFFTEKYVTITTPTQIIHGDGMEANQDFTFYKIINPNGIIAVQKANLPQQ